MPPPHEAVKPSEVTRVTCLAHRLGHGVHMHTCALSHPYLSPRWIISLQDKSPAPAAGLLPEGRGPAPCSCVAGILQSLLDSSGTLLSA